MEVAPALLTARLYPNPMNNFVNLELKSFSDESVDVMIYNVKGQIVKSYSNIQLTRGNTTLEWNGRNTDGSKVAAGIYFCKISSKRNNLTKKLILTQ